MTGSGRANPQQPKAAFVEESDPHSRSMRVSSSGRRVSDEEAALLGQPLIHATGGLSGLGAKQLSENDKFSCIVKYLLNYDVFKQVCALQMMQITSDDQLMIIVRSWRTWEH